MTLVRKRIGYQLEIADTFGYPTLEALANYIADQLDENDETVESNEQWVNIPTPTSLSDIDESECARTLLMFPGQGAQKPGMCESMKYSSSAKALFARAEKIIGYNIFEICMNNNDETAAKLKSTEFVQVVLLVGCLAKIEQLKEENPNVLHNVTHVSGLSVGEFAALVYAEVISFENAVRVIQIRGRAMENEVKQSATGMVSVFGPSCETLCQFLAKHYPNMKISTYLADNQHTIAGTADEVESLVNDLSTVHKEELGVIDARRLRVAGGFHSSYMENASKIVDPVIKSIKFSEPTTTLIMNVTGGIEQDPRVIKELLCEQLVAPVQWKQSVLTAYEAGVTNFIEVAPARVLSSIVKNRISTVKKCNCELIVV
ncbi:hypothetical protein LOTGIDRAFT_143473 [Lottia gigantea]|uniref:Carrier domain-containing protein n=1 Tax=Lottia gigantea TaxID=225164 RepID=V4ATN3_LOTGI|nr:hypothetical protein LOTGIDRAFT_143473 [Lottia gigantea]ESO97111.1 hypothetical protein LOTGIDRAFT_143473 [Lottia gigantea]